MNEDRLSLIKDLTSYLDEKSIAYEVILDDVNRLDGSARSWVYSHFTFLPWGRINHKDCNLSDVVIVEKFDGCREAVKSLVSSHKIKTDTVYVFWTNTDRPILKISFNDFIHHAFEIFEEDWDTWITAPNEEWCFEFHHDGELSFCSTR